MAIRLYDEALVNKIQSWIKDPNLKVLKPDETTRLFQMRLDMNNDKPITLPLISLSRDPNINLDLVNKRNITFDGVHVASTEDKTMQLNAIPITINYQLDIYTRHYVEGDEYLRNFIFKLINNPKLSIVIPYNDAQIEHVCYVKLVPSITDNSDISEKLFPDQFTRWTLQLVIQDAYLFSVPVRTNWHIDYSDTSISYTDDNIETEEIL